MLRKYLYISALILILLPSAVAQTTLHEEMLVQTDTMAL